MDSEPRPREEGTEIERKHNDLVCVLCPSGCHLDVTETESGRLKVRGAECSRGREYAQMEYTSPMRTFTGTVRVSEGGRRLVSVKSATPVRRDALMDLARFAADIEAEAPVGIGETVATMPDGIELVATSSISRAL